MDSTNETEPSGEMPVSRLLIQHIEPLLVVRKELTCCKRPFSDTHANGSSSFQKYSVDLAFWGHHHTYQRMCPVVNSQCTEGATTHIIIGMAGRSLLHNLRCVHHDSPLLYRLYQLAAS